MKIRIYNSLTTPKTIDLKDLSEAEERTLWYNRLANGSDSLGGKTKGILFLKNTQRTRDNFAMISEAYRGRFPVMAELGRILERDNYPDGCIFLVFNKDHITTPEKLAALECLLIGIPDDRHWLPIYYSKWEKWMSCTSDFEVLDFGFDMESVKVGEKDKAKRICRFCGKPHQSYNSEAHAISHSLGNEILYGLEECDLCNAYFSGIELQFIQLMEFRLALFSIRKKHKQSKKKADEEKDRTLRTIHGYNYTIVARKDDNPIIYIKRSTEPFLALPGMTVYRFLHYDYVINQDIYRTLVKMAIGLMPSRYLQHFKTTVEWLINKGKQAVFDMLPPIRFTVLSGVPIFRQPALFLFFRKNEEADVPFCTGVLFTTDVAYQFVVPYADVDEGDYKYGEELDEIWSKMDRYWGKGWELQPFFSWWKSYIWVNYDLDPQKDSFELRDDNDEIFKQERILTDESDRLYQLYIFEKDDFQPLNRPQIKGDAFISYIKKISGELPHIVKRTQSFNIKIDTISGNVGLTLILKLDTDLGQSFDFMFKISYKVKNLKRILSGDGYVTGTTFESLTKMLWKRSSNSLSIELTNKTGKSLEKIFPNMLPEEAFEKAQYEIVLPNHNIIRASYRELVGHKEM